MLVFVLGLVLFFGIHSVRILAPGAREAGVARMGEPRWKGFYALVSAVGFILILWGWSLYRPEAPVFYDPPAWGRHVAMAFVWVGFVLLAAAYLPAGHIRTRLRHPMLIGVGLWAIGHLLANGDLASMILFGVFLVYAAADIAAAARRGDAPPAFAGISGDLMALAIGTAAYAVVLWWLHGLLFGVSPV